jgi:hypothetical protein
MGLDYLDGIDKAKARIAELEADKCRLLERNLKLGGSVSKLSTRIAELEAERDAMATSVAMLKGERDDLHFEINTATNLLRELEWGPLHRRPCNDFCPICSESAGDQHAPDCRLAAVLKGGE